MLQSSGKLLLGNEKLLVLLLKLGRTLQGIFDNLQHRGGSEGGRERGRREGGGGEHLVEEGVGAIEHAMDGALIGGALLSRGVECLSHGLDRRYRDRE